MNRKDLERIARLEKWNNIKHTFITMLLNIVFSTFVVIMILAFLSK